MRAGAPGRRNPGKKRGEGARATPGIREPLLSFSERLQEIRTGVERPFWVANISELFERLSYYAVFAVLARYLHEGLHFDVDPASSLTGLFGGGSRFLALGFAALAAPLGFLRVLS